MKLRKLISVMLCMVMCATSVLFPMQGALAESGQVIYEDGYAIQVNADGTRTVTFSTTLDCPHWETKAMK